VKPAPVLSCSCCGRRIGKARTHWLIDGDRVICAGCLDAYDLYHAIVASGTRASIANRLGLWPEPTPQISSSATVAPPQNREEIPS
jgi:hypothetical protein